MKTKISQLLSIVILLFLSSCASVINTTGSIDINSKIERVKIYCTTPENVADFSTELCKELETKLHKIGINASTELINEMLPVLESDSIQTSSPDNKNKCFIMRIKHIRVTFYNGQPCNTLMDISIAADEKSKPIWVARVYTRGSNITGPGNPTSVSEEIISKMKEDGLLMIE